MGMTRLLAAASVLVGVGCTADTFKNQTASLGGDTAGSPGNIRVLFINNTPFRAIFTYGTYNNADQFDQPDARQFVGNVGGTTLEGNTSASAVTVSCDRVFSVGDTELLRLIDENVDDDGGLDADALLPAVAFSAAALGEADASVATEGYAPAVRALLGVDFSCGSILVIRLEQADVGPAPFRADFEVIPPREDDRGV